MDIMELVKSAPTTEGGGDFVLFDNKDQFVGQFKTSEEAAACAKERSLKCPFLCHLSILNDRFIPYFEIKRHVS